MSQTSKITLGIFAVVVILLGGFFYWQMTNTSSTDENAETTALPSGQATDDSSLEEDLASIDAQIQAVGSDNSSAGESIDAGVSPQ